MPGTTTSIVVYFISFILGFFIPGILLTRLCIGEFNVAAAFVSSVVILFNVIFFFNILSVPIVFTHVLIALFVLSALLFFFSRSKRRTNTSDGMSLCFWRHPCSFGLLVLGLAFAVKTALFPLSGFDTVWRWDFLAFQILRFETFSFYPPISSADYQHYFFPEGIPPLVAFCYWWIYASLGHHSPVATTPLIVLQWAFLLYVTFSIGRVLEKKGLFQKNASIVASIVLSTSYLFLNSLFIGQEMGFLTLGILATLLFLAETETHPRYAFLAAMATAMAGLSREYGLMAFIFGFGFCWFLKISIKVSLTYGLTALLLTAPWYVRNFVITLNPFFDNPTFGIFQSHPFHAQVLQSLNEKLSFFRQSVSQQEIIVGKVIEYSALATIFGIVGIFRRRMRFFALCIAFNFLIYCLSLGFSGGDYLFSMRILLPAICLLSLLSGNVLAPWFTRPSMMFALVFCQAVALLYFVLPFEPYRASPMVWKNALFKHIYFSENFFKAKSVIPKVFPKNSKILSPEPYLHAVMVQEPYEIIPVWSPNVAFLFDPQLSAKEIHQKLDDKNIRGIFFQNWLFMENVPFFAQDYSNWTLVYHEVGEGLKLYKFK